MTLAEFEEQVFAVALRSSICDIPAVRRLTATSISLRVGIISGGFIDAFFNEKTDTTAFAFVRNDRRINGVDNAGGCHVHPFSDPARHHPLGGPVSFGEFVDEIERFMSHRIISLKDDPR
jgi:hypothetical protein